MTELARILDVKAGWLIWGEGSQARRTRGVYIGQDGHFGLVDNAGSTAATLSISPGVEIGDKDAVLEKCYQLLDMISPDQPDLRVVR